VKQHEQRGYSELSVQSLPQDVATQVDKTHIKMSFRRTSGVLSTSTQTAAAAAAATTTTTAASTAAAAEAKGMARRRKSVAGRMVQTRTRQNSRNPVRRELGCG